jgi:hypothetical protein
MSRLPSEDQDWTPPRASESSKDRKCCETGERPIKQASRRIPAQSHIFEGMVTELVKNAKRFASPPPNILMDWTLKGGRLHFSVHDNGTSCPLSGADGFVPLDVFLEQAGVAESRLHGLDLINRISLLADGMLLFAKSQILSGLHVMFTITDIASGSSGG